MVETRDTYVETLVKHPLPAEVTTRLSCISEQLGYSITIIRSKYMIGDDRRFVSEGTFKCLHRHANN